MIAAPTELVSFEDTFIAALRHDARRRLVRLVSVAFLATLVLADGSALASRESSACRRRQRPLHLRRARWSTCPHTRRADSRRHAARRSSVDARALRQGIFRHAIARSASSRSPARGSAAHVPERDILGGRRSGAATRRTQRSRSKPASRRTTFALSSSAPRRALARDPGRDERLSRLDPRRAIRRHHLASDHRQQDGHIVVGDRMTTDRSTNPRHRPRRQTPADDASTFLPSLPPNRMEGRRPALVNVTAPHRPACSPPDPLCALARWALQQSTPARAASALPPGVIADFSQMKARTSAVTILGSNLGPKNNTLYRSSWANGTACFDISRDEPSVRFRAPMGVCARSDQIAAKGITVGLRIRRGYRVAGTTITTGDPRDDLRWRPRVGRHARRQRVFEELPGYSGRANLTVTAHLRDGTVRRVVLDKSPETTERPAPPQE